MSQTVVNGDMESQFIDHLTSYPAVSDSITAFKSNPYGKRSLHIADQGYATFAKPVLPYFSKPYEYVSPYVAKVDSIADKGLSKVDETFPIFKEPTDKIKGSVLDTVFFPMRLATESKDYVFNTYNSEYKKVGGNGIVTTGKAMVSAGLVVTSDSFGWISSFLTGKKDQAKDYSNKKMNSH